MLIECPACKTEISAQATACPKCGHPNAAAPAAAPKKVSHASGWIALAAFILANFTPAILAPIFVLVGLGFAGKELAAGGKIFGSVLLVLCLIQGWFVIDHFGHVSGAVGLTTAADSTKSAATQYANVSLDVEPNWQDISRGKCQGDWPSDYHMQEFCQKQQGDAVAALSHGAPAGVDAETFRVIRGKCAADWARDFHMRQFCEGQQYESYRAVSATAAGGSKRNSCAQQWPSDFHMRQYCESQTR